MFIYIGEDQYIHSNDIIMMIDQQYIESSTINGEMVEYQEEHEEHFDMKDKTKTIIITKDSVYDSPFSILTLKKKSSLDITLDHLDDYTDSDTYE